MSSVYDWLFGSNSSDNMSRIDAPFTPLPDNFYNNNKSFPEGGQTKIDPTTGMARGLDPAFSGYSTQKDTSEGTITVKTENVSQPDYMAKAVMHYADGITSIIKGGVAISNGYISKMSTDAKAAAYDFQATQNEREARLLLDNQMEVTRAAQMDANRYRIAGRDTETKQKVAMAASGFAVGKGTYKNTLNTTQARINYNISNLMLKADLTNAELTRKAGTMEAQAIINKANADIARKEGDMAVMNGWISGISNFISAGASFWCGNIANGALTKAQDGTK